MMCILAPNITKLCFRVVQLSFFRGNGFIRQISLKIDGLWLLSLNLKLSHKSITSAFERIGIITLGAILLLRFEIVRSTGLHIRMFAGSFGRAHQSPRRSELQSDIAAILLCDCLLVLPLLGARKLPVFNMHT